MAGTELRMRQIGNLSKGRRGRLNALQHVALPGRPNVKKLRLHVDPVAVDPERFQAVSRLLRPRLTHVTLASRRRTSRGNCRSTSSKAPGESFLRSIECMGFRLQSYFILEPRDRLFLRRAEGDALLVAGHKGRFPLGQHRLAGQRLHDPCSHSLSSGEDHKMPHCMPTYFEQRRPEFLARGYCGRSGRGKGLASHSAKNFYRFCRTYGEVFQTNANSESAASGVLGEAVQQRIHPGP